MQTEIISNITEPSEANATQQFNPPYPPLERVTKPTLSTAEYSYYTGIQPQTARIHACKESGPLRPIRVPGSSLLRWSTAKTKILVGLTA